MEHNSINSDQNVIADYYMKAVQRRRGYLQKVREEMGTENVYIEQIYKIPLIDTIIKKLNLVKTVYFRWKEHTQIKDKMVMEKI